MFDKCQVIFKEYLSQIGKIFHHESLYLQQSPQISFEQQYLSSVIPYAIRF